MNTQSKDSSSSNITTLNNLPMATTLQQNISNNFGYITGISNNSLNIDEQYKGFKDAQTKELIGHKKKSTWYCLEL